MRIHCINMPHFNLKKKIKLHHLYTCTCMQLFLLNCSGKPFNSLYSNTFVLKENKGV